MVFVDSLTVMLLLTGFSALTIAFYVFLAAKGKKDFSMLIVPGFVFGIFDVISGFIMSFTWPLPGSYNILFGDPILVLGLFMVAGSYMLYKKLDVRILSIFAVFLGVYILLGAISMYTFNLESGQNFISSFGFYIVAALSALFSPLVYTNIKNKGRYAYYFLFILLILSAFSAFFIGYAGVYSHLQTPP